MGAFPRGGLIFNGYVDKPILDFLSGILPAWLVNTFTSAAGKCRDPISTIVD